MSTMVSRLRTLALVLAIGAAPLGAQVIPRSPSVATAPASLRFGTIDGIVSDTNLVPIQAAFVSILGTNIRVGTGPNGRFRITKLPEGRYLVIVRRVGYHPTSGAIEISASDTARLSYTLDKLRPDELDPMIVTAKSPTMKMAEFEQRRKLGIGEFMAEKEIEQHNAVFSTELFRTFMSVDVSPNRNNAVTQYYALSKREGGNPAQGACPMQVYLDQVPLPTPFDLDLLPSPKNIAGIEVYAGAATIPPQFAGYNRGCGVILVWTKDSSTGS